MNHTPKHLSRAQACVAAILNEETMPMKDVLDCAGQCLDAIELAQQERAEMLEALKAIIIWDDGNLPGDLMEIAQQTIAKATNGENHA